MNAHHLELNHLLKIAFPNSETLAKDPGLSVVEQIGAWAEVLVAPFAIQNVPNALMLLVANKDKGRDPTIRYLPLAQDERELVCSVLPLLEDEIIKPGSINKSLLLGYLGTLTHYLKGVSILGPDTIDTELFKAGV